MPAVAPLGTPRVQYFDSNGDPLAGGLLDTYLAGTSTPQATYTDATGLVANPNPTPLSAEGYADVWPLAGIAMKYRLRTSLGVVLWTVDNDIVGTAAGQTELPTGVGFDVQSVVVPCLVGAGVLTAGAFLPAHVIVMAVKVTVDTGPGTSLGLVSFAVGDPETPDRWLSGGTLTVGEKTTRQGGFPKYAVATDLRISAEGGLFDATGQFTITRVTFEPGGAGGSGGLGATYSQVFTNQTSVVIPGTAHAFANRFLHVQVYDASGNAVGVNTLNIHPTTFDIVVTFGVPISGIIVVKN